MNQYLLDTKFAAEELIKLIVFEENQLADLIKSFEEKKKHAEFLHQDFMAKHLDPYGDFPEGQEMHAYVLFSKYNETVLQPLEREIESLRKSMANKRYSICALSGSLLQIAKQGISSVHGSLKDCYDGRQIRNDVLKNVIWQGRNQSMHFEEGDYNKAPVVCFNNLGYATVPTQNMAKEVIDVLGWTGYQEYEADMSSILP